VAGTAAGVEDGVGLATTGGDWDGAGCEVAAATDLLTDGRGAGSLLGALRSAGWDVSACVGCGVGLGGAVVVATTGAGEGGSEIERAEYRHHTKASTTAAAAPIMTGVSADRCLAPCSVTVFAGMAPDVGIFVDVGVIFCPVSGDESDIAGTPVIETIA
jgi:hypothetical protein